MKRCPTCNREYVDASLRFCLDDGTPLSDLDYRTESPRTQILNQRATPSRNASVPTIPSHRATETVRPDVGGSRRSNPILTIGVIAIALLLMALVAIAGFFVFRQVRGDQAAVTNPNPNESERRTNRKDEPATEPGKPSPYSSNENNESGSQTGSPLKIAASASSVRLAVQSNTYYPANAIGGKRSTAWIEGEEYGPGLGEWIRFDFDREINLHRILFQPGYFKSPQIWAQNNRLATVTAQFSDGSSRELTFNDRMDSQKIDIGTVRTKWIRLVIKSVYYGSDPDTAISEVAFEWDQE